MSSNQNDFLNQNDCLNLDALASCLRHILETQKCRFILLFAYNGVGKTRLSVAFKEAGKINDSADTLYFNAFTEDLFTWDNDFDTNTNRKLRINRESRFFSGLWELEMENRIRPLLQRYADFDFRIDTDDWFVTFSREVVSDETTTLVENIKVSRGEENIFIWCFFLAIAQLAIDDNEAYKWVKYIYVDDPISSLDDNNAIAVASHLAQLVMSKENKKKVVISSHHTLFFNVMWNEFNSERGFFRPFFLSSDKKTGKVQVRNTKDTPFFHHVAMLKELKRAKDSGILYTFHFNILRSILEKTAVFHGFDHFSSCIKKDKDDVDGIVHTRIVNILSHGKYSLFEPTEMVEENKQYFIKVFDEFLKNYRFNPNLFKDGSSEIRES